MSKQTIKKIKYKGFEYPHFLFCEKISARKNISSSARLDPLAAVTTKNPWQNSTAPSQEPEKRAIIFDLNSFDNPIETGTEIAFIKTLLDQGFRIFLKTGDQIQEINADINLKQAAQYLHENSLEEFWDDDYVKIANDFSIAKNKAVKISRTDLAQIKKSFFNDHYKEIWQYHHHFFHESTDLEKVSRNQQSLFHNAVYYFEDKDTFDDDFLKKCSIECFAELLRLYPENSAQIILGFIYSQFNDNTTSIISFITEVPEYGNKILENILVHNNQEGFLPFSDFSEAEDLLESHPELLVNLIRLFKSPVENFKDPSNKIKKNELESYQLLLSCLLKSEDSDLEIIEFSLNSIKEISFPKTLVNAVKNYPHFVTRIKKKINLKQYLEVLPLLISQNFSEAETYIDWIADFDKSEETTNKINILKSFLANPTKIPELVTHDIFASLLAITKDENIKFELIDQIDDISQNDAEKISYEEVFNYVKFAPNHLEKIGAFLAYHDISLNLYCCLRLLKENGLESLKTVSNNFANETLLLDDYRTFLGEITTEETTAIIDENNIFKLIFDRISEGLNEGNFTEEELGENKEEIEKNIEDLIFAINKKYLTKELLEQLIDDNFDEIETPLILFLQLRKEFPENSDVENLRIVANRYELDSYFIENLREKGIISHLTYIQIEDYRDLEESQDQLPKKYKASTVNEKSPPTFFYIPTLSDEYNIEKLEQKVAEGKLADSVVCLKINCIECENINIDLFKKISELFPNLSCLTLIFDSSDVAVIKKTIDQIALLFPNCQIETNDFSFIDFSFIDHPVIDRHKKPKKNGIYINSNQLNKSQINDANHNNPETYKMTQVGEALNSSSDIYVRTDIFDENNQSKNEGYSFRYNPKQIAKEGLKTLRKDKSSGRTHCKFSAELKANVPTRLQSININDEEVSVVNKNFVDLKNIQFFYGKNGFSYAISKVDQKLEYVVSAKEVEKDYTKISNDKIKEIIKRYKENSDKENEIIPQIENFPNRDAWLGALFESGNGRCGSRVEAVCYMLKEAGIDEGLYERIQINRNHVLIEIFDTVSQEWIQIDLGGVDAELEYESVNESESENESEIDDEENEDTQSEEEQETFAQKRKRQKTEEAKDEKTPAIEKYPFGLLVSELTSSQQKIINLKTKNIPSQKTLLISSKIDQTANELLKNAQDQGRYAFYLENFDQTNFALETLGIRKDTATIRPANHLQEFLQEHNSMRDFNASKSPILIINWDNFSASEKASLNTIIDANHNRHVNGQFIANNIQIISLVKTKPQDLSFISRHQECFLVSEKTITKKKVEEPIIIDIEGREDVESVLFGKFFLEENKIKWQAGKFTNAVQESLAGLQNVKFINLSHGARKKLEHIFEQAKARKKIDHYGYKINILRDLAIDFEEEKFDFSQFEKTKTTIVKDVTLDQSPVDSTMINTYLFDILLNQKEISAGKYIEKKGLIEENSGNILKLFITSNLSQAQIYCMLNEAKKYDCKLELYLAPNVELPNEFEEKANKQDKIKRAKAKIFVSNETKETTRKIGGNPLIIDVEDYSYHDLFSYIDFKKAANGFENFKKITSDVLAVINSGRQVILRGEFGEDLLKMLEPIIANHGENLTFVIEDKEISQEQKSYPAFSWLENTDYQIDFIKKSQKRNAPDIYKEETDNAPLDDNYAQKSNDFIEKRKNTFLKLLQNNSLLSLIGSSGVGKSSFMRMIKQEESHRISIHEDLANFEEWAKEPYANEQYKILFIDESNIEDMHFTMFEQLKKGGSREILYKGKLYQLTDKHRVVFARNPKEYGGGRVEEQKLFECGDCAEMHFADFPAAYLYNELLKKAIYDKLPPLITVHYHEREFRENCKKFIEEYQDYNKKTENPAEHETARELQDQALRRIAEGFGYKNFQISSTNFVSTDATKTAENALNSALNLKLHQKNQHIPDGGLGINGVLLEGAAGTGKSELIRAIFANRNIKQVSREQASEQTPIFDGPYCYYKIEASMPIDEKIRLLVKAFDEGNIAWIDELNSCIENDQLEKSLNALLTGINPLTKKPLARPGGLLVSSINSAAIDGRSIIGPALRHRMICPRLSELKEYKKEDFQTILNAWIPKNADHYRIEDLASDLQKYFVEEKNPQLNLRIIRENLEKFLEIYPSQKGLFNTSLELHKIARKRKAERNEEQPPTSFAADNATSFYPSTNKRTCNN